MIDHNFRISNQDLLFITLDSLRYDTALQALETGRTPNLKKYLPKNSWEKRYTPGNFTLPAHIAFFMGFLPSKRKRAEAPWLVDIDFMNPHNPDYKPPTIMAVLKEYQYRSICIGGVGFFNKRNGLGNYLPSFFDDSHWLSEMGVGHMHSTEFQINYVQKLFKSIPITQRVFLFINISATHTPHRGYTSNVMREGVATQVAALSYVDSQLPQLFDLLQSRKEVFTIICADHGEAYGEDGFWGHNNSHPTVMEVPFTEFVLEFKPNN